MSTRDIPAALRRQVIERAMQRCEYCHTPDRVSYYPPEIDHIISRKHGGKTELENLARACWRCNNSKGTDLSSLDPETGELTRLFNPRTDIWTEHFQLVDARLHSNTVIGRTTIYLLQLNSPERLAERSLLIEAGLYP